MINFSNLTKRLKDMNFAESITSVIHNGVLFPEEPKYWKENYGKFSLANDKLSDEATKQLFAWSTPRAQKESIGKHGSLFTRNFYKCLELNLTTKQKKLKFPEDFSSIISKMSRIIENYSEEKKIENKLPEVKEKKEKLKEKYSKIILNGNEYTFAYYVEGEGIFYGRGDCSYHGGWALPVKPEDVTINASVNVPCTVKGHHWKAVRLGDAMEAAKFDKYIMVGNKKIHIVKSMRLSNDNPQKIENDAHKFDKARLIQKHWSKISKAINDKINSDNLIEKQIGCCAYLIAYFGIRAGNDSGARNNGVVGASTLLKKNVILNKGNIIELKFTGKDSMDFNGSQKVSSDVFNAFLILQSVNEDNPRIFPNISSNDTNRFFNKITKKIPDLSNKNFRTYYGTSLLAKEIQKHEDEWSEDMTDKEFKSLYNKCVLTVAKKLNHQKTVSKEQLEKLDASTKEKLKKAKAKWKDTTEKTEIKIERIKEKVKKLKTKKSLGWKDDIKELNEELDELKEKLLDIKQDYEDAKQEIKDKLENKDVALNTSKSNYSNPKIAYSLAKFCKKEPKIILSPALVKRFDSWVDINSIDQAYWMEYPNVDDED